jgi:hypothetical protein
VLQPEGHPGPDRRRRSWCHQNGARRQILGRQGEREQRAVGMAANDGPCPTVRDPLGVGPRLIEQAVEPDMRQAGT